jgi:hypothetical protein
MAESAGPTQRHYRAPCPGCGAPVEFRSAQSTTAVCGYCQQHGRAREGEVLSRIGKMAELFDDHSPLQLMASGTVDGQAFTLVGRLQYKYREGTWTEWQALLDDGSTGALERGQRRLRVLTRGGHRARHARRADQFRVGATTAINGQKYSVASNEPGRADGRPGRAAAPATAGPVRSPWWSCAARAQHRCSASTTVRRWPAAGPVAGPAVSRWTNCSLHRPEGRHQSRTRKAGSSTARTAARTVEVALAQQQEPSPASPATA